MPPTGKRIEFVSINNPQHEFVRINSCCRCNLLPDGLSDRTFFNGQRPSAESRSEEKCLSESDKEHTGTRHPDDR